ncbi:hypothetical protein G6F60_015755 [Rhizopus arrhizus]|nr:hypothetical protein G6F60_015755 [Rhizopus arrhizus]
MHRPLFAARRLPRQHGLHQAFGQRTRRLLERRQHGGRHIQRRQHIARARCVLDLCAGQTAQRFRPGEDVRRLRGVDGHQ